ncbi:MAG TPA: hypothetical protein VGE04_13770, partial [Chloroflexia bacterium]
MTKWNHNRQRVLGVFFAIAMLIAVAGFGSKAVSAGPNIWTRTGPTALSGLVARDNVGGMYAVAAGSIEATYNGLPATAVYKSTDTGATWAAVGDFGAATESAYPSPFYLAVSPDGKVLMLNVLVNNRLPLLKSSDGGATWRQVVPYFETGNLVIDPTDNNRMYANGKGGFHRSTDGGLTWERMSTTSTTANAYLLIGQIAVNPARPSNVLAVTDEGVRASNDYGATWQTVAPPPAQNATLEQRTVPGYIGGGPSMLAFVPTPGGDSLVVSAEGSGIYVSGDGGRTWTRGSQAGNILHGNVWGFDAVAGRMYLALYPREGEVDGQPYRQLPLTLFTSTDGDNWTEVGPLPLRKPGGFSLAPGAIRANPAAPGRLFRSDGLFSGDGGETWIGPGRGLPLVDLPVQSFTTAGNDWYAGSGITVYRSSDKGASWAQLTPQAEIDNQPLESLFSEITGLGANEKVLLAYLFPHLVTGGPGGHYIRPATVIRSTDGGVSWQPTGLSINGREARFTFDGNTGTVYLAAAPIVRALGSHFTTRGDGGLYMSTDSGATWA